MARIRGIILGSIDSIAESGSFSLVFWAHGAFAPFLDYKLMINFFVDHVLGVFDFIHFMLRHVEGLELFVSSTFTCIDKISDALLLLTIIISATVKSNKLLNSQESSSNTDNDSFTLNLHEDLFPGKSVYSRSLSLEMHLASQSQRSFIDIVGQVLINWVVLERLVEEETIFDATLDVIHLLLLAFDLFVFLLTALKQLNRNRLGLLELLFYLK